MNWTAKGSVGKRRGKMTRLGGEAFMGKNRSKERVFFFFFCFGYVNCGYVLDVCSMSSKIIISQ